ncbi:hypothetical protein MMC14_005433 [Varicellaria rhodocarpa]|nr:hypothetical protein [Varicellaria rhodocarpa]
MVVESSTSVLAMTRGLIKAATSDNIQPLALMACEQFGTTLPMSTETRLKMEKIARKTHSTTLDFIKCQVGFSEGDSADYLSRTDGGVRFLGLAATLCSLRSSIAAAQMLEGMVQETAKDKQLLPTLLQYKSLLDALEPKLASSDFANSMLGWATVCSAVKDRPLSGWFYKAPGITQIQSLMQALARCFRLGEACTVLVESAFVYFPWTIAFVKWFTGIPPLVRTAKEVLLSVPNPLVIISEEEPGNLGFAFTYRVSLTRKVDNIKVLIHQDNRAHCLDLAGLVDVDIWMERRISNYEQTFSPGDHFRDVVQKSLWLIIEVLPERVLFLSNPNKLKIHPRIGEKILDDDGHTHSSCRTYPFASLEKRLLAVRYLLSDKVFPQNHMCSHERWKSEVRGIYSKCIRCAKEAESGANYHMENLSHSPFCYSIFVGNIAADLLALCLIVCNRGSPPPKVQLRQRDLGFDHISRRYKSPEEGTDFAFGSCYEDDCGDDFCVEGSGWADVVRDNWWRIISNAPIDIAFTHSAEGLFHHVVHLLGHGTVPQPNETASIIVSERHGQIIYPAIIEASTPIRVGYLSLNFFQGTLRWSGAAISNLATTKEKSSHYYNEKLDVLLQPLGIEYIPKKVIPKSASFFIWCYDDQAMDKLRLAYGRDHEIPLWQLINGLSTTVFSPHCSHLDDTSAGQLGDNFKLRPINSSSFSCSTYHHLTEQSLIPVHKSGLMQLIQIAILEGLGKSAVLHWKGCIACALKLCEDVQLKTVIC